MWSLHLGRQARSEVATGHSGCQTPARKFQEAPTNYCALAPKRILATTPKVRRLG